VHFINEIHQRGVSIRTDELPQRDIYVHTLADVIAHLPFIVESTSSEADFEKDVSECPNIDIVVECEEVQELGDLLAWSPSPRFTPDVASIVPFYGCYSRKNGVP